MASVISHAAVGAALSIAFAPDGAQARFWPLAVAAAVCPMRIRFYSISGMTRRLDTVGSFTPRS